ncbi:MAG: AIR carboxylase family protein [Anaerolineae bacterium]
MATAKVVIIMGSASDAEHAGRISDRLLQWGVVVETRIASAHKSAAYLLEMLAAYEAAGDVSVYIAIAGRSNALAGLVDATVLSPVITCPPYSDRFGGADLYSSLRMPSGVAPLVVLEPDNAALAAAKIIGIADHSVRKFVQDLHVQSESRIIADDRALTSKG